jgi:16S rRNA (cytidine1402-2'-O)-methyltransferase
MALYVVSTPIGNPKDITLHAVDILTSADLVIGEEMKVLRQILKNVGVQAPATETLNEHSDEKDIEFLVGECRDKIVALVSDCGTPGFCDPGADLVKACRKAGITVHSAPGASSLMALLSVAGERIDEFVFKGFLPAKKEDRAAQLKSLANESRTIVLMDTPYRLRTLLEDVAATFPNRQCILGLNLTSENENVIYALGKALPEKIQTKEAEPILLVLGRSR